MVLRHLYSYNELNKKHMERGAIQVNLWIKTSGNNDEPLLSFSPSLAITGSIVKQLLTP